MNSTTANKIIQYCLVRADAAQDQDQQGTADVLREVAVHAEALLERASALPDSIIGEPLVELRQDPDLVPCCPVCGELHQHFSDDPDGRWGCTCTDETYLLPAWLFWVAAHTECHHCGIGPSGDPDGLYCGTSDTSDTSHHDAGYCAGADVPVSTAEWIQRNEPNNKAGDSTDRSNKSLLARYGDQGIDQTVARLSQRVDQLALDQQHGYDHLASIQAADFATLVDKIDCDPMLFVKPSKPDPTEELPLVGYTLPYYELVLFKGPYGGWHVRCVLGADAELEERLGRLWFPDKQAALDAIKAMEAKEDD